MIQELKQNEKSEKYFYLREILVYSRVLKSHIVFTCNLTELYVDIYALLKLQRGENL